ncbi:MAG: hypothetical protein PGN23_15705 [Sphingomonas adhaesiva]|uniref:hypothetical protein n=1 Tax=Sphingomonas adhaesiva TaxID=28212 RepID=UPI002FF6D2C1
MSAGPWGEQQDVWTILDLAPTDDRSAIRRAYAKKLRAIDADHDAAAFMALREARDGALALADDAEALEGADTLVAERDPGLLDESDPAPESAPPPFDLAALQRLHAMLFDPAEAHTGPEAIAAQLEMVLGDPYMANLDHAVAMEATIAEWIAQGSPRSDPMLDPAIGYFRWDRFDELDRPPVVDWILRRREDRLFELGLPVRSAGYTRLLERLRGDPPKRWRALTAWYLGPRMEYLLGYLQTYHPTSFDSLNDGAVRWWMHRIEAQQSWRFPLGSIYERRRRVAWARGIDEFPAGNEFALYWAILVVPQVFVWFLLRRRHTQTERIVGFVYLAVVTGAFFLTNAPASRSQPGRAGNDQTTIAAEPPYFQSVNADLDRILASATEGTVNVAALKARNPAMYHLLHEEWKAARQQQTSSDDFRSAAHRGIFATLRSARKTGDPKIVRDYAKWYESQLRWALRADPRQCVDFIKGRARVELPPSFASYLDRLVGRALLDGAMPYPTQKDGRKTFRIAPALYDDARARSGLDEKRFSRALLSEKGTPADICVADIALIDAGVADTGTNGTKLLRDMF